MDSALPFRVLLYPTSNHLMCVMDCIYYILLMAYLSSLLILLLKRAQCADTTRNEKCVYP